MTPPKAVPSVQGITDVVPLEAPTSESTIPPLTPSDDGSKSNEDDPVSRAGQERPTNSSPTLPEKKTVVSEEVVVREPIVLVDPWGNLWNLPFEKAKTWKVCIFVSLELLNCC